MCPQNSQHKREVERVNFICFVCRQDTNMNSEPLASVHAVANHIAGKVRIGDYQHIDWLRKIFPDSERLMEQKSNEIGDSIEHWMIEQPSTNRPWMSVEA